MWGGCCHEHNVPVLDQFLDCLFDCYLVTALGQYVIARDVETLVSHGFRTGHAQFAQTYETDRPVMAGLRRPWEFFCKRHFLHA